MDESCLVMVRVQLIHDHSSTTIHVLIENFNKTTPDVAIRSRSKKSGARPNSARPITSSQQLSTHLSTQSQTHNAFHHHAIATHGRTHRNLGGKKFTRIRDGWREDSRGLTTRDSYRSEPAGRIAVRPGPCLPLRAFSSGAVATSGSGGGVDHRGQGEERRRDWKRGNSESEVGGTGSHIVGRGVNYGAALDTCCAALGLCVVCCVFASVSDR